MQLKIGTELTASAIRADRILHEAHATRGNTRRLTDLFGLSIKAASRYTDTVDHPDLAAHEQRLTVASRRSTVIRPSASRMSE